MRIIGGSMKGQRLTAPKGLATRPTSDRTRESLFNILANKLTFDGIRVMDLFAGTGALGLESISRGAGFCLFIEEAAQPRAAIRSNIEAMGLSGCTKLFRRDASKLGQPGNIAKFDLVFADPPYDKHLGEKAAQSLLAGDWLSVDGIFVLEERSTSFPQELKGFELIDLRQFGDTSVGLFKLGV